MLKRQLAPLDFHLPHWLRGVGCEEGYHHDIFALRIKCQPTACVITGIFYFEVLQYFVWGWAKIQRQIRAE